MVNSKDFGKRLGKIMDYFDLSAASFADKIEVGRSSISHILSGRNKPSLDFVMKVIKTFPEVELYWLLNGKGSFPKNTTSLPQKENSEVGSTDDNQENASPTHAIAENTPVSKSSQSNVPIDNSKGQEVAKVIIFYKNGSFEVFEN